MNKKNLTEALEEIDGTVIQSNVGYWTLSLNGNMQVWNISKLDDNQTAIPEGRAKDVVIQSKIVVNDKVRKLKTRLFVRRIDSIYEEWETIVERSLKLPADFGPQVYIEMMNEVIKEFVEAIEGLEGTWTNMDAGDIDILDAPSETDKLISGTSTEPKGYASPEGLTGKEGPTGSRETLQSALDSNDEVRIIKAVQALGRLKTDELIDVFVKAKELRSNKLMNLAKQTKLKY